MENVPFHILLYLHIHLKRCISSWTQKECNFTRLPSPLKMIYILRRSEKSILTLMIIFRVKINVVIYIEPRNGVKIFKKWVLGMSIFTQNLTRPPLRRKQNILKYRVYCIQKNRLCNTVSTKQSIN